MATQQQVRNEAAYLLGISDPPDDVSGGDDTYLQQKYNEVYAMLRKDGLNYWTQTGVVGDEYVPHVAALMAFFSTESYSIGPDRLQRIVAKAGIATIEIRKLGTPKHESTDIPKDY